MEYRSKLTLLGLPLIHVSIGSLVDGTYRRGVATGWIALGDVAIGILFSCGALAVGGISIGGLSLGALSIGGLALGLASLGGLSIGAFALGGVALGWYAAAGGLAIAHDYAVGGAAFAQHAVSPLSPKLQPKYPHPEAPFRVEDALWLLVIVVALIVVARRLQEWRRGQK